MDFQQHVDTITEWNSDATTLLAAACCSFLVCVEQHTEDFQKTFYTL